MNRLAAAVAASAVLVAVGGVGALHASARPYASPTPKARCGPGSRPETGVQGRVSNADVTRGRAAKGYTCNADLVSHYGTSGGFKVFRYVDPVGHECAIYDSTLLFPTFAAKGPDQLTGVFVLDMSNPAHPVRTATLVTPAMLSPHESLSLNTKRGILAADMGYPTFNPGYVDLYDLSQDCRHPVLKSSTPMGVLGHEGNLSPDGNTFYVSSAGGRTLSAVDVSNLTLPLLLWTTTTYSVHGLNISDDGNRMYFADLGNLGIRCPPLNLAGVEDREPGVAEVGEVHAIAVVADVEPVDAVLRRVPQQGRQRGVRDVHRREGPPTGRARVKGVAVR